MGPNVAGRFINKIDSSVWGTAKPYPGIQEEEMRTLPPTGGKPPSKFNESKKIDEGFPGEVQEKIPLWNQIGSGLKVAGKVLGTALLAAVAIGTLPVFIIGVLLAEGIGAIAVKGGADNAQVGYIQGKAATVLAPPYLGILELWGKGFLG